ncbi:MAG: DUF885 family protein, partial [Robiginitomaculum sp.]|nr:DUF885 family protein [Robiginitomaculum sp.]
MKYISKTIGLATIALLMSATAFSQTLDQTSASADNSVSFPEGTPVEQVYKRCQDMMIVNVDGRYLCEPKASNSYDSLEKIIADMQRNDLRNDPIQAGNEGNREALRHLPDVSPTAGAIRKDENRKLMARYEALDGASLPNTPIKGESLLNHRLMGYVLGQKLMLADFDTSRLPFTNDSGFFNMMSYVSRQTKFKTADDYEAYAARLSELPRFFDQHANNMRRGIATGYTASEQILPGITDVVTELGKGKAEEHAFYKPFLGLPDTIPEAEQARLKALGLKTMKDTVLPAYAKLLTFLQSEYAPAARTTVGIGTTQAGRAHYKALV